MLDQRSEFPHQFSNGACNMKFAITYLLVASSALLIEGVKSFQLTDKKNFKFRKKLQHHRATSNRRHQLNGIENTDRGFANFFDDFGRVVGFRYKLPSRSYAVFHLPHQHPTSPPSVGPGPFIRAPSPALPPPTVQQQAPFVPTVKPFHFNPPVTAPSLSNDVEPFNFPAVTATSTGPSFTPSTTLPTSGTTRNSTHGFKHTSFRGRRPTPRPPVLIPIGPEVRPPPPPPQIPPGAFDSAPLLPPVDPTGPVEPGQLDISDFNFSKLPARPPLPPSLGPPPPDIAPAVQDGGPDVVNPTEEESSGNDLKIFEAVPLFILQRLLNDDQQVEENVAISQHPRRQNSTIKAEALKMPRPKSTRSGRGGRGGRKKVLRKRVRMIGGGTTTKAISAKFPRCRAQFRLAAKHNKKDDEGIRRVGKCLLDKYPKTKRLSTPDETMDFDSDADCTAFVHHLFPKCSRLIPSCDTARNGGRDEGQLVIGCLFINYGHILNPIVKR